jgi:hypothetical protein
VFAAVRGGAVAAICEREHLRRWYERATGVGSSRNRLYGLIACLENRQRNEARLQHERVVHDFYQSASYYLVTGYHYEDGDYMQGDFVYKADGSLVEPRCPSRFKLWKKRREATRVSRWIGR